MSRVGWKKTKYANNAQQAHAVGPGEAGPLMRALGSL